MAIDLDKKLNEQGVSEIKYYYKKCPIVGNIFTACLMLTEGGQILARGISICSLSDCHEKQKARKISFERAVKAIFRKRNDDIINKNTYERTLLVVRKSFKIKDEEANSKLMDVINILPELDYEERIFNGSKRLDIYIPYTYPVDETAKYFEYKSEFQPKETEDEERILSKVKKYIN